MYMLTSHNTYLHFIVYEMVRGGGGWCQYNAPKLRPHSQRPLPHPDLRLPSQHFLTLSALVPVKLGITAVAIERHCRHCRVEPL